MLTKHRDLTITLSLIHISVRPNLYIACGISGAIQHVAGMESSEVVISINKNDGAAIFDVSDLGIVGDVKTIIPKLIEALKKR